MVHNLVYFPSLSDPLANLDAMLRFNYYRFNTMPETVVMGAKRFYLPPAADSLQAAINKAEHTKTFINRSSCSISPADTINVMNLNFAFSLRNDNTDFDAWTTAFNPHFFAGIFEGNQLSGETKYVLKSWLAFNAALSTLDLGQAYTSTITYNVSEFDQSKPYRVYYWLQDSYSNGAAIYFANYTDLPLLTSNADEYIPAALFSIYPNPVRGNTELKTSVFDRPSRISVFNLKGQLIYRTEVKSGAISLSPAVFPASGLYFVRSEALFGNYPPKRTVKLTVIK